MKSVDYLGAIGSLQYLATTTRPDLAYPVGLLAHFSANPGIPHWNAVKHIFAMSRALLTMLSPMLLTPTPQNSSPPSLMLIMVDARILGDQLAHTPSRLGLVLSAGAPSFSPLLRFPPQKPSTLPL
jgi:hypothetical protein